MLAVLAHKMIHTEDADAEYIYEINAQRLYVEVKELGLPFHDWYSWLTDKFSIIQSDRYTEERKLMQQFQVIEPAQPLKPTGIFDRIYRYVNREKKSQNSV